MTSKQLQQEAERNAIQAAKWLDEAIAEYKTATEQKETYVERVLAIGPAMSQFNAFRDRAEKFDEQARREREIER